jgi:hypothetical protein
MKTRSKFRTSGALWVSMVEEAYGWITINGSDVEAITTTQSLVNNVIQNHIPISITATNFCRSITD